MTLAELSLLMAQFCVMRERGPIDCITQRLVIKEDHGSTKSAEFDINDHIQSDKAPKAVEQVPESVACGYYNSTYSGIWTGLGLEIYDR
jgi:hypothetical protein